MLTLPPGELRAGSFMYPVQEVIGQDIFLLIQFHGRGITFIDKVIRKAWKGQIISQFLARQNNLATSKSAWIHSLSE